MNKFERHQLIKNMIKEEKIGTQKDIQTRLEALNIQVTQTTLSRDLRELGLTKIHEGNQTFYAVPNYGEKAGLAQTLAGYVHKVERAEFMLVMHTSLGEAAIIANMIDGEKPDHIIGTIAGADTLLVICRNQEAASQMEADINHYL